jgi:ribosomal protein L31E
MSGRGPLLGTLVAIAFAVAAAPASATVDVTNHNDPAGDPTVISYRIQIPSQAAPIDFALRDGEYKGFGPFQGAVVVQALVPAGWEVADIQCTGPNPAAFTIDVPNGRVTLMHGISDEQFCSFTNRRKSTSGGSSSGVTPTPAPGTVPPQLLPRGPALLGVKTGRGYAAATVRITRRSVIKTQLWRGRRVVGTSRVVRKAGVYDVTVSIDPKVSRSLRHQGRKRVQLTLRVVVAPIGGLTRVFRYRVLVRL